MNSYRMTKDMIVQHKVAVVGLGQMGKYYINNMLEMGIEPTDIVGVDIDPDKITAAKAEFAKASEFPGIVYLGSLFSNGDGKEGRYLGRHPTCVLHPYTDDLQYSPVVCSEFAVVATNTPSHVRVIEELCELGIRHIFCEKPLGMSVEETDQIERAVRKVNGQVYTAFLINFSPAVSKVLKMMEAENLVLSEGQATWGKNRFGDPRPSAGDTEDECIHGAELLKMFANVNRRVHHESVSARISYLNFLDEAAQAKAHEFDQSFPLKVDSSTFVVGRMESDVGPVNFLLSSSFLLGEQVRTVRLLLANRENPNQPRYAARLDFDMKRDDKIVDILQLTDIPRKKNLGEELLQGNKIHLQLAAFMEAIKGCGVDNRLTPFFRGRSAVCFTKAVQESHQKGGVPVSVVT